jgi:SpoVK/Ycf46/Vps4 family AAA+-type ATPase
MTIYKSGLEYILDELQRIDLLVCTSIEKWNSEHTQGADDFRGLYVSENEVNTILGSSPYESCEDARHEKVEKIAGEINEKKANSIKKGKELRLHDIGELFKLSPFEIDALLICLAPELDLRYEKLYSYLQNDVTKNRPGVDLVLNLLCPTFYKRLGARESFSQSAPLIKNRLCYLQENGQGNMSPLLSKFIKVDERIIEFLLGKDEIDQRIRDFSIMIKPRRSFDDLILPQDDKNTLMRLVTPYSNREIPPVSYFYGPYGTGKKTAAEAICKEVESPLIFTDCRAFLGEESSKRLDLVLREGLLNNASLYFEGFDVLLEDRDSGLSMKELLQKLDNFPNHVFLSGEIQWEPKGVLENRGFSSNAFPLPSYAQRMQLWESLLNGCANTTAGLDIGALASKFKFSAGQMKDAIFTAKNLDDTKLNMDALYHGCKAQSNKKLNALSRKLDPHYIWEDIVLPKDTKEQLREVCGYIKHKGKVYNDWGFDRKLSLGKGLNALFSGPSGTGKTMAAEIIAKEAGLDLYKIDLSCVVSKYIGETEKNLRKVFTEAETSNAILFFDEADALFGKRSEVKDSHDRYANIEINYLLQKMEEHEGIAILASNFGKNIDEAFIRRMHFTIEFPLPDEKSREKIWRNIFPEETPLGKDLDLAFLSKFKITGGNIKNIALSSAFLAAEDSARVKMEHAIKSTKREFQKMGKLCTEGDFEKYYGLVK